MVDNRWSEYKNNSIETMREKQTNKQTNKQINKLTN